MAEVRKDSRGRKLETFTKSGRKVTTCTNYKSYYNTMFVCVKKKYLTQRFSYCKMQKSAVVCLIFH